MSVASSLTGPAYLAASGSGGAAWGQLVLFAVIGLAFYLLFLRPQRNRVRRAQELQSAVAPGQMIMTTAGLFGTVAAVEGDAVLLEVAPGVVTRWNRAAIGRIVTPEEALGLTAGPVGRDEGGAAGGAARPAGGDANEEADPSGATRAGDDPVR